jgi:dihydroxy-acid dehydratase
VTIQDVFEAVGANAAGRMSDAELLEIENVACPGAGACGGQYTANTMATVLEFIGLSPFGSSSVPATDPRKDKVSFECGKLIMDIAPGRASQRYLDAKGFETPLPASRHGALPTPYSICWRWPKAGIPLNIDDFDRIVPNSAASRSKARENTLRSM